MAILHQNQTRNSKSKKCQWDCSHCTHCLLFEICSGGRIKRGYKSCQTTKRNYQKLVVICCCFHFLFILNLQRLFRRLQVIILPTPENVKRHTTSYQRFILDCSLQLKLTEKLASGAPCHMARSSTGLNFCQSELLWTVTNTAFGSWGVVFVQIWFNFSYSKNVCRKPESTLFCS